MPVEEIDNFVEQFTTAATVMAKKKDRNDRIAIAIYVILLLLFCVVFPINLL
jgi:hypothetical protein